MYNTVYIILIYTWLHDLGASHADAIGSFIVCLYVQRAEVLLAWRSAPANIDYRCDIGKEVGELRGDIGVIRYRSWLPLS